MVLVRVESCTTSDPPCCKIVIRCPLVPVTTACVALPVGLPLMAADVVRRIVWPSIIAEAPGLAGALMASPLKVTCVPAAIAVLEMPATSTYEFPSCWMVIGCPLLPVTTACVATPAGGLTAADSDTAEPPITAAPPDVPGALIIWPLSVSKGPALTVVLDVPTTTT